MVLPVGEVIDRSHAAHAQERDGELAYQRQVAIGLCQKACKRADHEDQCQADQGCRPCQRIQHAAGQHGSEAEENGDEDDLLDLVDKVVTELVIPAAIFALAGGHRSHEDRDEAVTFYHFRQAVSQKQCAQDNQPFTGRIFGVLG